MSFVSRIGAAVSHENCLNFAQGAVIARVFAKSVTVFTVRAGFVGLAQPLHFS